MWILIASSLIIFTALGTALLLLIYCPHWNYTRVMNNEGIVYYTKRRGVSRAEVMELPEDPSLNRPTGLYIPPKERTTRNRQVKPTVETLGEDQPEPYATTTTPLKNEETYTTSYKG